MDDRRSIGNNQGTKDSLLAIFARIAKVDTDTN